MPDWKQIVRERLPRLEVSAAREAEIIDEIAQLLEDRHTAARDEGCDEPTAFARAIEKFPSGEALAKQILEAERPAAAQVPARLRPENIEAKLRRTPRGNMLQDFLQDVRGALRLMQKNPGFSAVVVLTLALGIGANSAIFSMVNRVVFQPLPYADSHQLVRLFSTNTVAGFNRINLSYPDMQDFAANSRTLEGLAGWSAGGVNFTGDGGPERLDAARVTAGFFELVRLQPLQGRGMTPADFANNERVVVITEGLWRRRFGGGQVAGRRVVLNGNDYSLIGVMPHISGMPEAWIPLEAAGSTLRRNNRFLSVLGRMKPGVTLEQVHSELSGIAANLRAAYPDTNRNHNVRVEELKSTLINTNTRTVFAVLMGFVTMVLMIACANIANLLLARSTMREREIAVRATLGASRGRLLRQLLTESLILAAIGGVLGVALSFAGVRGLLAIIPTGSPRADEIRVDAWTVIYTAALSLITGIIFGLAPALQLARTSLLQSLRQGGHGLAGDSRGWLRKALVTAQVAVALTLLVCAGIFGHTFYRMLQVQPGFDPENVLTFRVTLPRVRYAELERMAQLYADVAERLRALPGVTSAGFTSRLPIGQGSLARGYMRDGDVPPPRDNTPVAIYYSVSSNFLDVMRIPLRAGRNFTAGDHATAPRVAIINQILADELWPGQSAVGKRIRIHTDEEFPREVIGVAGNVYHSVDEPFPLQPQVYVPHWQDAGSTATFVVRISGDPYRLRESAQAAVRELDANLPLYDVRSMEGYLDIGRAAFRALAGLLAGLGGAALALASMGIYGVVSYAVGQRTQEIGVRIALGAQPREVTGLMLRQGMVPVVCGLGAGLALGFAVNFLLAKQLAPFVSLQPLVVLGASALLTAIALLACWSPAQRAARVDPLRALRYE